MKILSWLRTHYLMALVPLAIVAVFVVSFFTRHRQQPANSNPNDPQVLGENSPRNDPVPAVAPQAPALTKPLELAAVEAKSYLVYDVDSQTILARDNEDYALPVASLTKLMTAFVSYQRINLSQETITITTADNIEVSPSLGVRVGDHIKAIDLFNSMLIGSANDAAQTLASYINEKTGIPFKDLMNQTAKELGMVSSHFSNPMGFDSETNYATAADLRRLVNATKQFQAFSLLGHETGYSFKSEDGYNYSVKATNKLLTTDPEVAAIKTGFTEEAQGAMITEITHQDHKFIIIVLGSANREQDTLKLKKAIIASYQW